MGNLVSVVHHRGAVHDRGILKKVRRILEETETLYLERDTDTKDITLLATNQKSILFDTFIGVESSQERHRIGEVTQVRGGN